MVTKIGKIAIALFSILILSAIFYFNQALDYGPALIKKGGGAANEDLLAELRALKEAMNRGAAGEMQKLYPEGYLFMNSLYALAWADFADPIKDDQELYIEALTEIESAYRNIDSDEGRSIFHEELSLPYGAFYNGWRNYVLGRKLEIEHPDRRDTLDVAIFGKQCDVIALAIQEQTYPPSYTSSTWPADGMVCVASLALYDRLYFPKYDTVINSWLQRVKSNLDLNGLLPHKVHSRSGEVIESARGSSMSLMLIFLKDIDPEFARQQFETYKKLFVDFRFGLPGIREYPKGTGGYEDVDSGPVILGIGASATIVGLRTFIEFDDRSIPLGIRNGIESFGLPINSDGKKEYLFGQLPMADAFIAWVDASDPMLFKLYNTEDTSWRLLFRLYSLAISSPFILLLLWTLGFRFNRRSKK